MHIENQKKIANSMYIFQDAETCEQRVELTTYNDLTILF